LLAGPAQCYGDLVPSTFQGCTTIPGLGIRGHAHRLWTRLPQRWRQRAYERVTCALAPKAGLAPELAAGLEAPFIVAGPLSAPTGLGESARLLLNALIDAGRPVSYVDLSAAMMQKQVVTLPDLPPPARGPATLLLAVQPPSVGHALLLLGRDFLAEKRRVGFWMWELETLPSTWRQSVALVHHLAAPSKFATEVLSRQLNVPVLFLGFAFRPPARAERLQRRDSVFTFGVGFDLGSTAARKNPFGALEAFARAFPRDEPVRLMVKVRGEASDPDSYARLLAAAAAPGSRIELVAGDLNAPALERWYGAIDVLVSLHRSEGFGLFPAEAMLRGIPVISTDWSATTEFVLSGFGWPVPAALVPVNDLAGRYALQGAVWADPDLDAAADAMRECFFLGRAGVARRGKLARAFMSEHFSLPKFCARLDDPATFTIQPGNADGFEAHRVYRRP
jgi:glycosyltransferase involved in cell wall biosynthesis